jgi:TRAP-type mannitol/chloroaromatic compound transport system permease small subunit
VQRFDAAIGKLSDALAVLASLILLAMMLIICGDVFTRNVVIPGVSRGLA